MLDKITFWLWHKEIAGRVRNNLLGAFVWETRVQLVYKPLFEKGGLRAVYDEHARHISKTNPTAVYSTHEPVMLFALKERNLYEWWQVVSERLWEQRKSVSR